MKATLIPKAAKKIALRPLALGEKTGHHHSLYIEPGGVAPEQAADFVQKVVDGRGALEGHLAAVAIARCDALADAHKRVRAAAQQRGVTYEVRPQGAPDVLGIYVYLPAPTGAGGAQ